MSKTSERKREVREMSRPELENRLGQARGELFRLRFQQSTKQLTSPARLRTLRKDIARILTRLGQMTQQPVQP
jgi:large subunit ribosomal protein L29